MKGFRIPVPGSFLYGPAFVDLETEKVDAPPGFVMKNGEALRRRWSVILSGVAVNGEVLLIEEPFEEDQLSATAEAIDVGPVIYAATREFDEMILKGRFTNARRAHEDQPFFSAMPGAEKLEWQNLGVLTYAAGSRRLPDIESRFVPVAYRDGRRNLVLVHLLRDVVELILAAGEPDNECRNWCAMVLSRPGFAREEIWRRD